MEPDDRMALWALERAPCRPSLGQVQGHQKLLTCTGHPCTSAPKDSLSSERWELLTVYHTQDGRILYVLRQGLSRYICLSA